MKRTLKYTLVAAPVVVAGAAVGTAVALSGGSSHQVAPAHSAPAAPAPVAATPPPTAAPPTSAPPATIVSLSSTGPADDSVEYGPSGSSNTINGPGTWVYTVPTPVPDYYAIDVNSDLTGAPVTCTIAVNGTVLVTNTASGSEGLASCEISQDPVTGMWQADQ